MKPCLKYIIILVLLCLLVEVTPSSEKKTRSNQGAAGDPDQTNEKEQTNTDNKKGDDPNQGDTDNKKETLEDKENHGAATSKLPISPTPTPTADFNCTNSTDENCKGVKPSLKEMIKSMVTKNKGMLTRTMYVLLGVTVIVVVYYVMRAVRLRKKSKTKKYGVISSRDADLEMRPLEEDDDEEDVTVFEVNGVSDFRSTAHR